MLKYFYKVLSGPNFMALLTTKFCDYNHHSSLTERAPNFCFPAFVSDNSMKLGPDAWATLLVANDSTYVKNVPEIL